MYFSRQDGKEYLMLNEGETIHISPKGSLYWDKRTMEITTVNQVTERERGVREELLLTFTIPSDLASGMDRLKESQRLRNVLVNLDLTRFRDDLMKDIQRCTEYMQHYRGVDHDHRTTAAELAALWRVYWSIGAFITGMSSDSRD